MKRFSGASFNSSEWRLTTILAAICLAGAAAAPGHAATLIGRWALDETSGTVAADSSGNGLDGNCVVNGLDVQILVDCLLGGPCTGIDPDGDGQAPNLDAADDIAAFSADATALPAAPCS